MKIATIYCSLLFLTACILSVQASTPTEVTVDGVPCVDTELSVSFTHEGSTQTVAMTRMEVFAKHYEHSDAIPRCAYMGHSGASALFEGPELYKLYVDKLVVSAEPSSAAPASERDPTISRSYQVAEARLPDDQLAFCGHTTEHEKQHFSHPERSPRAISSRFTDYPDLPAAYRYVTPPPSPCLSSVRTIQINLVADYNFTQAYGSSNSAVLTEMAALTSYLSSSFTATANIAFQLGQTFIFPTATSGFNDPNSCVQSQPSVLLDAFTAWVNQQGTSYPVPAVWVLLTQCMNNGVVGLAYVGQACQSYNTGYASIIPNAGHLVFTHEVGHLMGASHDTSDNGGIMMPAAGYWDTFSQNSQNYFCSYISGSSIPSNCFVATGGTTASTASTAATTAAATTTAATTAATTAGTGSNSDILNVINAKRAQYNQPALTWSSNAESYAASAASSCNWGISWPATQTYTAYRSAATTNMGTTILSFVSNIVNNANYNCASDTCGSGVSSFNCAVFRSWMSSSTTAIGCSISVCPASTMTWGSPQQSWNFLACSSTPYAVYSSQTPFPSSSCPAGKEVLSEREASSQCPDLCANRYCGVQQGEDGCPDQVCGLGSCLTGATCSDEGQCVCTPITTCDMVGACVVTVDNCGNELDCTEGCNPAGPCTNPVNNSICDGLSCGRKWNGCEWVSCGLVQEGQSCQNFQASTCDESCHASFGQCDPELGCVCKPGYEGDGFSCVPQTEANIIDALCSGVQWEAAFGDAASFLAGGGQTSNDDLDCAFYHSASSESHANNGPTDGILFTSFSFNTGADTLWGASITRDNAYGPVGLLYASGSNLIQFWHNGGGKYLLQATKGDKVFRKTVTQGTWSAEDTKTLTLILRVDGTVVPSIDNQTFNAYQLPSGFDLANNNNQVGLLAGVGADATFSGLQLLTTARVTFSIFGDWSETEIENLLTQLLGVAASQITNIDVAYDSGVTTVTLDISGASQSSSQKRLAKSTVARAAVVANPASAASLATQLESWLAASSAVRGGFVGASPALAQGAAPATLSAAGGGSGLSAGAIVGIVIGSVAGAALLGGVVIYALTAGSSSNDDVDEDNTAPARPKSWRQTLRISWHPRKAPRGGVNLDPGSNDKHRSLTARNPNIADQYS